MTRPDPLLNDIYIFNLFMCVQARVCGDNLIVEREDLSPEFLIHLWLAFILT